MSSPTLYVVLGTRAQTIKMAPVLRELEGQAIPFKLLLTGQHSLTIPELLSEFEISTVPQWLYRGAEVSSLRQVVPWVYRTLRSIHNSQSEYRKEPCRDDVYLVHGDTFSTLLGMYIARKRRARVVHVESGLRSYNWRNPFPEELIRLIAMRHCDVAFAPGKWASGNMGRCRARTIDTEENTLLDSVRFATRDSASAGDREWGKGGVLFSIHRFETLYSEERLTLVQRFALRLAEEAKVTFVLHPATRRKLESTGLMRGLVECANVVLRERMTYIPFLSLASGSDLVITDGGSNQEELSYLGVPTILMREATERQEGIGDNVFLGHFDANAMLKFALDAIRNRNMESRILPSAQPSCTIVDEVQSLLCESER